MVAKKSINFLKDSFNKVQKIIIKYKIPIVIFLGLVLVYLGIFFSTRNLDHFQDTNDETTSSESNEDNCDSFKNELTLMQENKKKLEKQITDLENQMTTIEKKCNETETGLISEKESLSKQLEDTKKSLSKQLEDANSNYANAIQKYNDLNEEYDVLVNENKNLISNKEKHILDLQKSLKECNLKCTESFQDTQNNQNNQNNQTVTTQPPSEMDHNLILKSLKLDNESILSRSKLQNQLNTQVNINDSQNKKLKRLSDILFKQYK